MEGKLTVICGPMFAGKTTELLRVGKRYSLAKKNVVYIKPNMDNRYSENDIVTHVGEKVAAISIDINSTVISSMPQVIAADVVLIDEIQFFSSITKDSIHHLVKLGKKVYVSGLDLTADEEGFSLVGELMLLADEVRKISAVCSMCGNDAARSYKKNGDKSAKIELGADDMYAAVCKRCYYELLIK